MPKSYLGKECEIEIDRPIGSSHPKYPDCIYPINYGFISNTVAGDDKEIDVYLLRETKPLKNAKVKIVAVIIRENDVEFKLVAVPLYNAQNVTVEEIKKSTNFIEQYFKSTIVIK